MAWRRNWYSDRFEGTRAAATILCGAAIAVTALHLAACGGHSRASRDEAAAQPGASSPKEESANGSIVSIEELGLRAPEEIRTTTPRFFERFPAPEPVYAARKFIVRFRSRDFDGSPVVIRSQVFVPETEGELPLYVFASGTTGIGDACAPSLEVPEQRRWGWYEQNMLAYAAQGFIVMFPDYTGFNDPDRPQRYFSKLAEGRMMLDSIRAAFAFFENSKLPAKPSQTVFTAGYSQGGHAAMAAADLRRDYAPEVPLTGIITFGSTNDVEALIREGPAYAPLIFYSYRSMYGGEEIPPAEYLQAKWMPTFDEDASTMAVDVFQSHYGFDYRRLYKPDFSASLFSSALAEDYPSLAARLAENYTGVSGHGLPALVVQGADDFIVTEASQSKFVARLRAAGSEVEYRVYPRVGHRYTRMAGFNDSLAWMRSKAGD